MRERDADSEVGWITIDAASQIIDLNTGAANILGTTRENMIGRQVTEVIPPEFREAHYVAVTRRAAGGESRIAGLPLRLPMLKCDGTRTDVWIVLQKSSIDAEEPTFTATFFEVEQPKKSLWRRFWEWGA